MQETRGGEHAEMQDGGVCIRVTHDVDERQEDEGGNILKVVQVVSEEKI